MRGSRWTFIQVERKYLPFNLSIDFGDPSMLAQLFGPRPGASGIHHQWSASQLFDSSILANAIC